jgi:hypothetical protein
MRRHDHRATCLSIEIDRLHDRLYNEYQVFSAASVRKWSKFGLANGTTSAFRTASRHPTICGWPIHISALREKRALVAGLIEKLERKLEQNRADLTHIDGVLRLFQPDRDPGEDQAEAHLCQAHQGLRQE